MLRRAGPLLAMACAPWLLPHAARAQAPVCSGEGVRVLRPAEQGGIAECSIARDGSVTVRIAPERADANPSPWYAFYIDSSGARPRRLVLRYAASRHRYAPWIRTDAAGWRRLPADAVRPARDGSATVTLPPAAGRLTVAAQPFAPVATVLAPWHARAVAGQVEHRRLATTPDGAALEAFLHRPARPEGVILLVARQHPPERGGGWAFDAFTDALFADSPAARALRARYAILAVPLANPDGFVRGNWRGSAAAADLNRDWGRFAEPEAAAIRDALDATGLPVAAVLDFHATQTDRVYAPPEPPRRDDLAARFLRCFAADPVGRGFAIRRSHQQGSGSLKGWALDRYGLSGMTVELGDDDTPAQARAIGEAAAHAFLSAATETPAC